MLLTTDEYRELHSTALEDEALQLLLDAAEADIIDFTGSVDGSVVEWLDGGQRVLALARRAASITSIVEDADASTPTTLETDDYLLDPTGFLLYRSGHGTNRRWRWYGRTVVTYVGSDTESQRKVVQADLITTFENYNPGVGMTVVGSWTEQYSTTMGAHENERQDILSRLTTRGRMLVVGG